MKVWILVLLSLSTCLISSTTEVGEVSSEESVETEFLQNLKHHLVILYDESRGIWIKLTDNLAFFNMQGGDPDADYWYLIAQNPTGYWASDNEFVTQTSNFKQSNGVVWLEHQGEGNGFSSYVRINQDDSGVTIQDSQHLVVLYDDSRKIWIMLTDDQAFCNSQGGNPWADYWYLIDTGYWINDSQFIMQTGYFIQQYGRAWWIHQQAANSYNFIMQQIDTQA